MGGIDNGAAMQSRFQLSGFDPESAKLVGGTASDPRHLHSFRRDPEQGRVRRHYGTRGAVSRVGYSDAQMGLRMNSLCPES